MSEQTPANASPSPEAARTLIAERDRLRTWLDQLATHGAEVPGHVLDRVRGDYRERLQRVTAELGDHLDALRQSLTELRELQGAAEQQHAEARDALAEARLRHLIGELDASAWEERRPALEEAVSGAERELGDVGAEVERMVVLVKEIEGGEAAAAPAVVAEAEEEEPAEAEAVIEAEVLLAGVVGAEDEGEAEVDAAVDELFAVWAEDEEAEGEGEGAEEGEGEVVEALPWLAAEEVEVESEGIELEFLREVSEPTEPAAGGEAAGDDALTDLAFLEELDRVIASTAPAAQPNGAEEPAQTAALVCKECGASNDARSWYCEICGMELT